MSYRVDGGDWTEIVSINGTHGSWTEWTGSLPAGALAENVEIGFWMTTNWGDGVGLDDILLEAGGHSFTYSAEGAAITAVCQNDPCALARTSLCR